MASVLARGREAKRDERNYKGRSSMLNLSKKKKEETRRPFPAFRALPLSAGKRPAVGREKRTTPSPYVPALRPRTPPQKKKGREEREKDDVFPSRPTAGQVHEGKATGNRREGKGREDGERCAFDMEGKKKEKTQHRHLADCPFSVSRRT